MADISISLPAHRPVAFVVPRRLRARWRLFRRDLRRDLFSLGRSDRQLADIGRTRTARHDWLSSLMQR